MTPAQQTALESLAGRALTPEEIAAIEPLLPGRQDMQIAALLPPRTTIDPHPIGVGTILAMMYPSGGAFLDALEVVGQTDSNVKWAFVLITGGNLDVGVPLYRAILQQFAAAMPDFADGIAALLATAERSEPIQYIAVSNALNVAEGRLTL